MEKKTIEHHARIVTYIDEKKKGSAKIIRLLTNDLETEYEEIVAIYKARWAIESLFKQIKQNFPLRYFYTLVRDKQSHFSPAFVLSLFNQV